MSSRCCLPLVCLLIGLAASVRAAERPPNIVYIMSDELAYYELSHMGNGRLRTPNIDQMAREGIRFTQALAAAPVCGPLRACMMTGKHMGHCSVRDNPGGTPLRAGEPTIASMLKQRGYATGGFGKWGAGGRGSTGVPEQHGFDDFFGYYDQVHAHSFYPPYLVRNSQEVPLPGNDGGREGETYSHYEIMKRGKAFIRENKDRPFFCYFPVTPPHGMYDIPADDPAVAAYKDDAWFNDPNVSQEAKNYAAMVTMIDNDLRSVLDLLRELNLEDNTIVFFTGDNGGQDRFRDNEHPRGYFGPNKNPVTGVEFRGGKGNLYEGGLRIPYLVRWPGKIKAGQVSDLVFSQVDVFPTLAELTGAEAPGDLDGMSILTELIGAEATGHEQPQHEFLYWEYGPQTAVRMGQWKAIQPKRDGPWALYDLDRDVSETTDLAKQQPDVLAKMIAHAEASHQPVQPGTFESKELHERDRQAKWGSKGNPVKKSSSNRGLKINRLAVKNLVPADEMKLVRYSSENTGNEKHAANAIDGNPETIWHSRFDQGVAQPPHELVIDLGATYQIDGFRYLARQDGGWNGAFAKTDFTISGVADSFGEPSAAAAFGKVRTAQKADCETPVRGRYVRVRVFSEVNGKPWASAAEIGVVGQKMP
ncbi:sulfatase-like hydrolase/transferase [Planctomycetes bacterium TBK1r]|uniref:Arylsulfatase n=1 Tax=Stieleria magnilauensis TaxID=2527963 RepID=A0ABX5XT98_9BACT|nr:Arylsulfatase [Planctomycetes bacterium TBK1r]